MAREAGVTSDPAVLDEPVSASLAGAHAHLARREGGAVRYEPEVASFTAVPLDPTADDWADLARLLGPGALADLFQLEVPAPAGWEQVFHLGGVQMVYAGGEDAGPTDVAVATLTEADRPEMFALAEQTRPGPFWARTPSMGRFVGIREEGRLVAMAGERLRPPGWTEVSAVCTHPDVRGRGLAGVLIADLVREILARGEQPFLHVISGNDGAVRLYERLGFSVRREVVFHGYRAPD